MSLDSLHNEEASFEHNFEANQRSEIQENFNDNDIIDGQINLTSSQGQNVMLPMADTTWNSQNSQSLLQPTASQLNQMNTISKSELESELTTLKAQLENVTQDNMKLRAKIKKRNHRIKVLDSRLAADYANIQDLLRDVDGFATLKRASIYLLSSVARGSNEDINNNFVAFASYFRRIN